MSPEDEPKKPRRTRPRRASEAFGRLAEATNANPVPGGEPVTSWRPQPVAPPASNKPIRRFNLRIYHQSDSDAIDQWVSQTRAHVDGKIDVSRVARELMREMVEDPALSERVRERLRNPERPTR